MRTAFRYTARERSGRTVRGRLEADSPADALARLHGRRLTPLAVAPQRELGRGAPARLGDRHARDLARTLAQLLRSGLPLVQALRFAADELEGPAAAAALRLREAAERGERPSSALGEFAGAPARLLAGVLLAGETSGRLAPALQMAAETFARSAELRTRVATSMIYPAFVILATLATLGVFVFFVTPTLAGAFQGSETQLPASTRRLLAVTTWLRGHTLGLLAGTGACGLLLWRAPGVRGRLARMFEATLASPAGLGIAPRLEFAAFARLTALSLDAGVPAAAALETAAASVRGDGLRARLAQAMAAMRVGERPSEALARLARPPRTLVRLMQVGEETGDLGAALGQAAALLASEAEQRLQRLGAIAGPVITLGLGGLVASVVLSLFLGLLAMSDLAGA